ncbi:MAG: hypothetical protein US99_C0011G0025 [Candidatus Daviesbacteria bacterium GW2011_GWF2_38_6]|uniref:Uncharacterized protein n=1 Tax=Candidatus Daviesbacteria bacterium GW2011_GWF2_38_6 TaxID=1618432 RepID=A0A0G0KTG1_9BACT|nr:MAG: hypothetical protein US99_C0011G0025 [Candidatus Daviesbacteria bacterium GW2011_GWF2_38_6]
MSRTNCSLNYHIRRGALEIDVSRACEGLVVNLHRHGFDHRRIPFTVQLIPIYSPRTE